MTVQSALSECDSHYALKISSIPHSLASARVRGFPDSPMAYDGRENFLTYVSDEVGEYTAQQVLTECVSRV